jgi:hypothetical protein
MDGDDDNSTQDVATSLPGFVLWTATPPEMLPAVVAPSKTHFDTGHNPSRAEAFSAAETDRDSERYLDTVALRRPSRHEPHQCFQTQ